MESYHFGMNLRNTKGRRTHHTIFYGNEQNKEIEGRQKIHKRK